MFFYQYDELLYEGIWTIELIIIIIIIMMMTQTQRDHRYWPHVISVIRLYHIGHTSIPYRPHVYIILATGQTISSTSISATDKFSHLHIGHTFSSTWTIVKIGHNTINFG